jgi:hypothetical protein
MAAPRGRPGLHRTFVLLAIDDAAAASRRLGLSRKWPAVLGVTFDRVGCYGVSHFIKRVAMMQSDRTEARHRPDESLKNRADDILGNLWTTDANGAVARLSDPERREYFMRLYAELQAEPSACVRPVKGLILTNRRLSQKRAPPIPRRASPAPRRP